MDDALVGVFDAFGSEDEGDQSSVARDWIFGFVSLPSSNLWTHVQLGSQGGWSSRTRTSGLGHRRPRFTCQRLNLDSCRSGTRTSDIENIYISHPPDSINIRVRYLLALLLYVQYFGSKEHADDKEASGLHVVQQIFDHIRPIEKVSQASIVIPRTDTYARVNRPAMA